MNPEDRIRAYLSGNQSKLQYLSLDQIVKQVKLNVFFGMSPIQDDAILAIIKRWAMFNLPTLLLSPGTANGAGSSPPSPGGPQSAPSSTSDMLDAVKKAVSTVADGVTLGSDKQNVVIKVTGATANLKRGNNEVSLGISWGGTLEMNAHSGPFYFNGTLAKDKWEISLTFPRDSSIPDMSKLGDVFRAGEKSVRNLADAASKISSVDDAKKISALVKPDISAVQEAADALSSIADHPSGGGISFGFKLGSPDPMPGETGMPKGYQGTIVFTYTF